MSADGLITAQANSLLTTASAASTWIQLHTGFPGAAGTANVATNNTRKQATWGSVAGGSVSTTADLAWTSVAGAETYTHFSAWSASTAGTCGFTGSVTASAVAVGDNFTILAGNLTAAFTVAA